MAKLTPPNAGDKKDTAENVKMENVMAETSDNLTDDVTGNGTVDTTGDTEINNPQESETGQDTVTIVKTDLVIPEAEIKKADESETKKDESPQVKANDSKLVTIRIRQNHECSIGYTRYSFQKRQMYRVPLNVKKILERANLLDPL